MLPVRSSTAEKKVIKKIKSDGIEISEDDEDKIPSVKVMEMSDEEFKKFIREL